MQLLSVQILEICLFKQHLAENLDMDLSALEFMMKEFPEVKERDEMRKIIGRYGLTGQQQVLQLNCVHMRAIFMMRS